MSYYTRVDIQVSDHIDAVDVLVHARAYLDAKGIYAVEDVLEDLNKALSEGSCLFKGMTCGDFEGLMQFVSDALRTVRFFVRGMGEEFPDVWLRQFEDGKSSSPIGPFDVE
jgi:hypothetical protein